MNDPDRTAENALADLMARIHRVDSDLANKISNQAYFVRAEDEAPLAVVDGDIQVLVRLKNRCRMQCTIGQLQEWKDVIRCAVHRGREEAGIQDVSLAAGK